LAVNLTSDSKFYCCWTWRICNALL